VTTDGGEEDHLAAFLAVSAFYEQLLDIKSDPVCKDYSHLSFVSYDPDAYYKEDSILFSVPDRRGGLDALLEQFRKYNAFSPGTRNAFVFKFGLKANEQGFSEFETATFCAGTLGAPDFDATEIRTAIASAFKENRTFSPPQNTPPPSQIGARTAQVHLMPPTEADYTLQGEDNTGDTEELIKRAPAIQSFVYDNLPLRLDRVIRHCKNDRQRDVMLISSMVALSACLPKVTGRYGPKTYSSHLFFFLLAEAASGKGEMEFAGKLLNKLDDRFLLRYEEDLVKYKKEHDRWEFDKDTSYKAHREFDIPEPQQPKEVELKIPANISKSMVHHHLDQNGIVGCAMIDAEANSLVTANKQECGCFEAELCKAFHHEAISASYRILGKTLRVRHPKLALVLSGTPDQLGKLIPNKKSGLFSRILFLTIPDNEDWVDQTPDYTKISVEDQFENEGENVLNDYDFLEMHPTDVRLTDTQWKLLNRTYSMKLKDVCLEDDKTLKSIVKRHGLMTLRLAMVLTALRKAEDKSFQTIHYCTEMDYKIATEIICCCLEHSFLLSTTLPDDRTGMLPIRIAQPMQAMFGKLPSPFTLKQALEIGETLHIKKRTLYAYLKKADGIKIEKLAPGVYRKL